MKQCVKIITHDDHMGFISEIQGWFNTQNTINVIHNINNPKKKKPYNHIN